MTGKEEYFQTIDRRAPGFELVDADGKPVALSEFADRIVVMHFINAGCPDVCPLHADRIAEIQGMINQTPMKDRVQFISITTDPANDTRSEEHTSELQSLMRISYAVFCLKKKNKHNKSINNHTTQIKQQ